jgi:hypothetical protein
MVSLSHFRNNIRFAAPSAMYSNTSLLLYPMDEMFKHHTLKKTVFSFRNYEMKNATPYLVVRNGSSKSFSKQ